MRKPKIPIRDLVAFAVLGTIMYISFALMQGLPNIHLLAVIVGAATLCYRTKALIPIYIYVTLSGIFSGFSFWWLPYLYIWLPLWLGFMLAGRLKVTAKVRVPLYMLICGLHGLLFGIMYAPVQAIFFGLNLKGMFTWVLAGLWFDVIHALSNTALAVMIIPLYEILRKISEKTVENTKV